MDQPLENLKKTDSQRRKSTKSFGEDTNNQLLKAKSLKSLLRWKKMEVYMISLIESVRMINIKETASTKSTLLTTGSLATKSQLSRMNLHTLGKVLALLKTQQKDLCLIKILICNWFQTQLLRLFTSKFSTQWLRMVQNLLKSLVLFTDSKSLILREMSSLLLLISSTTKDTSTWANLAQDHPLEEQTHLITLHS